MGSFKFHENLQRNQHVKTASNTQFGFTLSLILALWGGYLCWAQEASFSIVWLMTLFSIFISVFKPTLLSLPNRLWSQLGLIIAKVTNPLILVFFYYMFLTPLAITYRFFSANSMGKQFVKTDSQWVPISANEKHSMEQQF